MAQKIIIARKKEEKPKLISSPLHLIIALVFLVAILFLLQTFLIKPYTIPTGSMKPTINPGERILVDRFAYRAGSPQVDDIVVFRAPVDEGEKTPCPGGYPPAQACFRSHQEANGPDYVKRIVAGPGDRLRLVGGELFVNDKKVMQQFSRSCRGENNPSCNLPKTIKIPQGHYFVLGDNRGNSFDSRYFGPIASDWIVGKARITYWPPDKIGSF